MNSFLKPLVMLTLVFASLVSPLATFAEDIRDKVQPATKAASNEAIIDTQGIVYGVPFGATEDTVIQKFGKPSGYTRVDAHRTALLYGKSYLLLCHDGIFDGLLIDQSAVNWKLSQWMVETAPFTFNGWGFSNGLKSQMNRKEVKEIVKAELEARTDGLTFSTEQCMFQLGFSHWTNRGDGDDAYMIYSLLMTRKHDGGDYWSLPPARFSVGGTLKGSKVVGIVVTDNEKGVRVTNVFSDSPAAKAGILAGDLITGLNGESVVGMKAAEFRNRMAQHDVNKLEITADDESKRTVQVERVDGATLTH